MSSPLLRLALPQDWQLRRLDELLAPRREQVAPLEGRIYREIGIRSHGKGIFHKDATSAEALGSKRVFQVVPHCLVLNIVFAWEGAVAVTTVDEEGMIASHRFPMFEPLTPACADVDYLRRYFATEHGRRQLSDASPGGAGRNRTLNQREFGAIQVPIPPLSEQRKIAAILASVDDTIDKTEVVIAQLQVVKKAMMHELLTRGMPGRHTRFKQTEIGEIPEGWEVVAVGDVCETKSGGTPDRQRPEYWGGTIPWVKTGEVKYSTIGATEEHISDAGMQASSAQIFPAGTVIMAMYGQGATRGRVARLGVDAATNQACLALLCGPRVRASFLFHSLVHRYDELRSIGNEGSQKNLSAGLVRAVRLPVPSLAEQEEIASCSDALDARIEREHAVHARLASVKSALTGALLSGETRVTHESPAGSVDEVLRATQESVSGSRVA